MGPLTHLDERRDDAGRGAITRDAVLTELDRIVASPAFGRAERPARFLRHLVETALREQPQILKESVLGVEVFDRPVSWDTRLDPVVRQEAGRLRKRLANYYDMDGAEADIRIELPVGSYVPVFRRKSIEIETAIVEPAPVRRRRVWPVWAYYGAAGVVFIVAALIAWRAGARHESVGSIVVLPFTNLSADPADQYFSDS